MSGHIQSGSVWCSGWFLCFLPILQPRSQGLSSSRSQELLEAGRRETLGTRLPILQSTQSPRVNSYSSYSSSMTARRKCRKIDFKKKQCWDKGQKSDFYVFISICFCQIPFTMLTMFVPVIRKTVSRFPCSLRFFFFVPLENGHVPLFAKTPGRPSLKDKLKYTKLETRFLTHFNFATLTVLDFFPIRIF